MGVIMGFAEEKIPIPEFYGVYFVSKGKLIQARDAVEENRVKLSNVDRRDARSPTLWMGVEELSGISLSPRDYFLLYQKLENNGMPLKLYNLKFIRQLSPEITGSLKWHEANMWMLGKEIPLNVGPVKEESDLYRLVPTSQLEDGVYALITYTMEVVYSGGLYDETFGNFIDFVIGSPQIPVPKSESLQVSTQTPLPSFKTTPEKITIDWLTRNLPYGDRNAGEFQAREKTYNVTFDDAWAAVNNAILKDREEITTSERDKDKGVLIGQGKCIIWKDCYKWTAAIIERITEYSVKITIKSISYRVNTYETVDGVSHREVYVDSFSYLIHKNLEKELKSKVKQPPYLAVIEGKQYKVSGDIFTGKKEGRVFKDEKGAVVRDLALAKKIAQAAWVYENVVKATGLPGSKRVSAILETHKRLRQYELAQGILARASVQILAATISGGATLTYTVPAGLTWRVVREQFLNLKGLLSLTGRQGLEEALSKYQQIESSIANLKPNSIDEVTAFEIRRLYEPAHGLELSCGALLTSLMPKRGRQLLEKALKDIGDELVRTLPLSDEVLTTREVLDLQGKMDDALKTNPALKEYYEKLDLAKRLREANEQVITAWAEQAVGYKE
jgi:hypothetical protein